LETAGICCIAEGQSGDPSRRGTRSNLKNHSRANRAGTCTSLASTASCFGLAGGKWKQIPLNFNVPINAIHVASDGRVKIGGDDGNCFEYSRIV